MHTILNFATAFALLFWVMMFMMSPMMFDAPGSTNDKSHFIQLLVIMYYPAYIFLLYTIAGWTFFGWSGSKMLLVSVLIITGLMTIGGYFSQFSNVLQGIANSGYSVAKGKVFYDAKAIDGADADTFAKVNDWHGEYARDKQRAYYRGAAIENSDPQSFRVIEFAGKMTDYYEDRHHVYYRGKLMPYASPDGFRFIDSSDLSFNLPYSVYAGADGRYVYYHGAIVPNADLETFEPLSDFVARDRNSIYEKTRIILPDADAKSFHLLNEADYYGADDQAVYEYVTEYKGVVKGLDPHTIRFLGRGYLKDKNAVYHREGFYRTIPVIDADAATFEVTDDENNKSDARDKHGYYRDGKRLPLKP